jgi:hypothetical protein
MSDVTRILEAIERGEPKAAEELLPLVYEELRKQVRDRVESAPDQVQGPRPVVAGALPITNRRYGRSKVCATPNKDRSRQCGPRGM